MGFRSKGRCRLSTYKILFHTSPSYNKKKGACDAGCTRDNEDYKIVKMKDTEAFAKKGGKLF